MYLTMNGLIILLFYQKKRITEQVRNDDAMKINVGIKITILNKQSSILHWIVKLI